MQMRLITSEIVWLIYYAFIAALSVHKLHQFCQVSECGQVASLSSSLKQVIITNDFCDFQWIL